MAAPPPTRAPARVRATSGFRMPNRMDLTSLLRSWVSVDPLKLGGLWERPEKSRRGSGAPPTSQPTLSEGSTRPQRALLSFDREPIDGCGPQGATTEEGHGDPDSTLEA